MNKDMSGNEVGIIKFKATRRMHDSGYRLMEKSGHLAYDLLDHSPNDVVWITVTEPQSIKIDCERDGTYRLMFDPTKVYLHNPELESARENLSPIPAPQEPTKEPTEQL